MSSTLSIKQRGDVTVARFRQRILDEPTMQSALAEIDTALKQQGCRKLLLNMKDVEYLSSAALGSLINLHKKLVPLSGRVALVNVVPQIFEVFAITKLDRIFKNEGQLNDEFDSADDDDPDAEANGVPARLIPPKPSNGGALRLYQPPPEPE